MYNYFMGSWSNALTKHEGEPTVICVSSEVSEKINHWLDYYVEDLDELMKAIVAALKIEVTEIIHDNENEFYMKLTNNHQVKLELLYLDEPKCKIYTASKEMTIALGKPYIVESFIETIGNIRIGADILDNAIKMGYERTYIVVELEEYDSKVYDVMKSHILRLSDWENIACVMTWIKDLPITIASYELAITYVDETGYYMTLLSIIYNRIFRYTKTNKIGKYRVDYDGTWEAEHDIFWYHFNVYEHKCKIGVPKGTIIPVKRYSECLTYVWDYTNMMFQTIKLINNTFDSMEKAKK